MHDGIAMNGERERLAEGLHLKPLLGEGSLRRARSDGGVEVEEEQIEFEAGSTVQLADGLRGGESFERGPGVGGEAREEVELACSEAK